MRLMRLITAEQTSHFKSKNLLLDRQSAYCSGFSTETAVLRVLLDILEAVDERDVVTSTLFDLSAAFDTVDHAILLRHIGFDGTVLRWSAVEDNLYVMHVMTD